MGHQLRGWYCRFELFTQYWRISDLSLGPIKTFIIGPHAGREDFDLFEAIHIERDTGAPLYRQVYEAFRDLILIGTLVPDARLPSTRTVAAELSVSRNTVVAAFEQLAAEGFIELKRHHRGSANRNRETG